MSTSGMISRRKFLSHGCSLGLATATLSTSLLNLGLARRAAAQGAGDYRALVCILLAGGNDSWNMVVPTDTDQYGQGDGDGGGRPPLHARGDL